MGGATVVDNTQNKNTNVGINNNSNETTVDYDGAYFQASRLPIIGATLAGVTILTTYCLTVWEQLQPAWLPDITHTAMGSPQRYIFRMGLIPASMIISFMWFQVYAWVCHVLTAVNPPDSSTTKSASYKMCCIGAIGGLCLVVSSSCIEEGPMPWTTHTIGATSFFVLTIFAQFHHTDLCATLVDSGYMSQSSYGIKWWMKMIQLVLLLGEVASIFITWPWFGNLLEWLLTLTALIWFVSLSGDFQSIGLIVSTRMDTSS